MRQSLSFVVQVSLARLAEIVTVRTGCSGVSESGANIIFIEKCISFPTSLQHATHVAVSQSDIQCFSHEDGCFAAGNAT